MIAPRRKMRDVLKLCCISALFLPLPSCAPAFNPPAPDVVLARHPQSSPDLVRRGYTVHQEKCGKCHGFEDPARYSASDLAGRIIPEMSRKSKLETADQEALLAYLIAVREKK